MTHNNQRIWHAAALDRRQGSTRPDTTRETVIVEMHWESPENRREAGFWRGTIGRVDPDKGREQRLAAFDGIDQLIKNFGAAMRKMLG